MFDKRCMHFNSNCFFSFIWTYFLLWKSKSFFFFYLPGVTEHQRAKLANFKSHTVLFRVLCQQSNRHWDEWIYKQMALFRYYRHPFYRSFLLCKSFQEWKEITECTFYESFKLNKIFPADRNTTLLNNGYLFIL